MLTFLRASPFAFTTWLFGFRPLSVRRETEGANTSGWTHKACQTMACLLVTFWSKYQEKNVEIMILQIHTSELHLLHELSDGTDTTTGRCVGCGTVLHSCGQRAAPLFQQWQPAVYLQLRVPPEVPLSHQCHFLSLVPYGAQNARIALIRTSLYNTTAQRNEITQDFTDRIWAKMIY